MKKSKIFIPMNYDLNDNERAVIAGFHMMGADDATITAIMDTSRFLVEKTIYDYKKQKGLILDGKIIKKKK